MPSPKLSGPSEYIPYISDYSLDQISLTNTPEEVAEQLKIVRSLAKRSAILDDLDAHETPIKATFVSREEFGIGRDENGRHDIDFGQLLITSRNRREIPALVASKSYESHELPTLRNELAATNYMNGLAEVQNSFLPIGVWRNTQGIVSMLTLYEHGVKSYDNTFWVDKEEEPEALRQERLRTAFQDCIWGLGYMHGAGLIHGDAQVKNLAHDGKNVRFIDLEDVALMPKNASGMIENSPSADSLRLRDVATFIATSLQVDENRGEILKVLQSGNAAKEIATYYKKGLTKGGRDSELSFEKPLTMAEATAIISSVLESITVPILKHAAA